MRQNIYAQNFQTQKSFTAMDDYFNLHGYTNSRNQTQIIHMFVGEGGRKKVPTGLYIAKDDWNSKTHRSNSDDDLNLLLDNLQAKVTKIKTFYRLTNQFLDVDVMLDEYTKKSPSVDFIAFMENEINTTISNKNTRKTHLSVVNKLREFKSEIPFNKISHRLIYQFRKFCEDKENNRTTVNSNISRVKKYLNAAKKYGVIFNCDIDEIYVGSTEGQRTALFLDEVQKLKKYFFDEFISYEHKLTLGYFLFSCYTGLRVSDIQNLTRASLTNQESFTFLRVKKPRKTQTIFINKNVQSILEEMPELFVNFKTDQTLNSDLKNIAVKCKIQKNITMHVGRHTFATSFLRKKGNIYDLQKMMGHTNINTTMTYVHILEEESARAIFLLDD